MGNEKKVGSSGQQTDFKRGEKTKVKGYKKMKCLSIQPLKEKRLCRVACIHLKRTGSL